MYAIKGASTTQAFIALSIREFLQARSNVSKNPTNFLHGKKIQETEQNMGYRNSECRSQLARKAALDGLGRVQSDKQRTRNTRANVRQENTVQVEQIQRSRASRGRAVWDTEWTTLKQSGSRSS